MDFYANAGFKVLEINGEQSVDNVFSDFKKLIS